MGKQFGRNGKILGHSLDSPMESVNGQKIYTAEKAVKLYDVAGDVQCEFRDDKIISVLFKFKDSNEKIDTFFSKATLQLLATMVRKLNQSITHQSSVQILSI